MVLEWEADGAGHRQRCRVPGSASHHLVHRQPSSGSTNRGRTDPRLSWRWPRDSVPSTKAGSVKPCGTKVSVATPRSFVQVREDPNGSPRNRGRPRHDRKVRSSGTGRIARRPTHPAIGIVEVVDPKEEGNPAVGLGPHDRCLALISCTGKQDSGLGTRWSHHHPAFPLSALGLRRCVLDEVEPQRVDEELDGRVVLVHDKGDQVKVHRRRPTATTSSVARWTRAGLVAGRHVSSPSGVVARRSRRDGHPCWHHYAPLMGRPNPTSGRNRGGHRGVRAVTARLCEFRARCQRVIPLALALRQPRVIQSTAEVPEERNAALQT